MKVAPTAGWGYFLFHVEHDWAPVLNKLGLETDAGQRRKLSRYRDWLVGEAIPAGGLGPDEAERIDVRHISDSLLFSSQIGPETKNALDVGTGVGLPGIPLAIVYPGTTFHLVDRSGRRVDLVRRALRILDLPNVVVEQADFHRDERTWPLIVSRATLDPESNADPVLAALQPGGLAVFGGSWVGKPDIEGWEVQEVGRKVLDREVWILIMRRV